MICIMVVRGNEGGGGGFTKNEGNSSVHHPGKEKRVLIDQRTYRFEKSDSDGCGMWRSSLLVGMGREP